MSDKIKYYRGNPNLLQGGEEQEYTEEQIQEILRCKDDYEYFIYKYVRIKTKKGLEKPEIRNYQQRILGSIYKKNRLLIMAGRQCGKSLSTAMYIAWYICFHDYKTVGIVANKEKVAKLMLASVKNIFVNLPLFLKPGVEQWGTTEIKLDNNSVVTVSACSADALTGYTLNLLVVDEVSKIPKNKANDFFDSVLPTVEADENAKIICISCVTKDTFVFTDKGLRKISNFVNEEKTLGYQVENYKVLGKDKLRDGNTFYNSGKAKTKIIETSFSKLECTEKHKLWANKNGHFGWYEAKDLNVGDHVAIQYGNKIFGNDDSIPDGWKNVGYCTNKLNFGSYVTEELSYFFGLFLAEGYGRKKNNQITISCGDDISHVFNNLKIPFYKNKDNTHYSISSKSFFRLLEDFGFDFSLKAKNKIIPDKVLSMSEKNIKMFLRGFFDGNGTSHKNKGVVSCVSASKELIDQVKMLLLNFGIMTNYFTGITPRTKKVMVESVYHRIEMDKNNSKLFYDTIGFGFERKQKNRLVLDHEFKRNSHDIIPFSGIKIKEFKKINKTVDKFFSYNGNGVSSSNVHLSRHTLLRFKDQVKSLEIKEIDDYFENIQNNIKWLKIKNITDSENFTYDFSLDHNEEDFWCHSVLYNGILGHQTPKGLNIWYKMWTEAEQGLSGYDTVRVEWYEPPGRDEEWRKKKIAEKGLEYFEQEYGISFLGSAGTLLKTHILQSLPVKRPIKIDLDGCLKIYDLPKKDKSYVAIVDVSEGLGKDYSTIQILDVTLKPYKQVCVYRNNNIKPLFFHDVINNIGKHYNNALVIIENNSIGMEVLNNLNYMSEYENIFYDVDFGIRTTKKTKSLGCSNFSFLMDQRTFDICDYDTIQELSRFVRKGNSYAAQDVGDTDDLVTPFIMFSYFLFMDDYRENWLENVKIEKPETIEELLVSLFIDDGIDD